MGEEYHYLLGAEDVKNAGYAMQNAADDMKRAASSVEDSLQRHQRHMDDWLNKLEQILSDARQP